MFRLRVILNKVPISFHTTQSISWGGCQSVFDGLGQRVENADARQQSSSSSDNSAMSHRALRELMLLLSVCGVLVGQTNERNINPHSNPENFFCELVWFPPFGSLLKRDVQQQSDGCFDNYEKSTAARDTRACSFVAISFAVAFFGNTSCSGRRRLHA